MKRDCYHKLYFLLNGCQKNWYQKWDCYEAGPEMRVLSPCIKSRSDHVVSKVALRLKYYSDIRSLIAIVLRYFNLKCNIFEISCVSF